VGYDAPEALDRVLTLGTLGPKERLEVTKVRDVIGRSWLLTVDFYGEVDGQHGKEKYHQAPHFE